MAHDAGVAEQTLHVALAERGHRVDLEIRERRTEVLALAQDREPREPGLEALEHHALVEAAVVAHRPPPLLVVVALIVRRGSAPPAARAPVRALPKRGHDIDAIGGWARSCLYARAGWRHGGSHLGPPPGSGGRTATCSCLCCASSSLRASRCACSRRAPASSVTSSS